MMEGLNKIELRGYTGNVDIKAISNGLHITFSMCVPTVYNLENSQFIDTEWFNVQYWVDPKENPIVLKKGDWVEVVGRIKTNKYVDVSNKVANIVLVIANKVKVLGDGKNS